MNFWVDKRKEFAGEFKKTCNAQGIQIYSKMSETKTAFAELTIGSSKHVLYRYMEHYGYKCVHKLSHFVTTLSFIKKYSIALKTKDVKISNFLSILYNKALPECRKPKCKNGNKVRISKYDLPFRKSYNSWFTREFL